MTGLVGDGAEEGAEYLLTDLAKFTRYAIVVQAVNQVGPGPLSEPVTAQTLEDGEENKKTLIELGSFLSSFYKLRKNLHKINK